MIQPQTVSANTGDAGNKGIGLQLLKSDRIARRLELNQELKRKNAALLADMADSPDQSVTDEVALSLVFRFISGNKNPQQRTQVRGYMSQVLGVTGAGDQDELLNVSETYLAASNQIHMQSEAVVRKYHPAHEWMSVQDKHLLRELSQSKKSLVRSSRTTLRRNMSSAGWTALNANLETRVKSKVKAYRAESGGN